VYFFCGDVPRRDLDGSPPNFVEAASFPPPGRGTRGLNLSQRAPWKQKGLKGPNFSLIGGSKRVKVVVKKPKCPIVKGGGKIFSLVFPPQKLRSLKGSKLRGHYLWPLS